MNEKDIELFLTLKFTDMDSVLAALRNAAGVPEWADTSSANPDAIKAVLQQWVELGAPNTLEITRENAELFLRFKFGSIDNAYDFVISCPPGLDHGLSEPEYLTVLDHVKITKKA